MTLRDAASYAMLGRALENARDDGVLEHARFAPLALALGVASATGAMPLDAYADIHRALADVLEAAFAAPAPPSPSQESQGEGAWADGALGGHLEIVEAAWERVEPPREETRRVAEFFSRAFDLPRATFAGEGFFRAPLNCPPDEIPQLLRAAGFSVFSISGALPETPRGVAELADAERSAPGVKVKIGWGERRLALFLA